MPKMQRKSKCYIMNIHKRCNTSFFNVTLVASACIINDITKTMIMTMVKLMLMRRRKMMQSKTENERRMTNKKGETRNVFSICIKQ